MVNFIYAIAALVAIALVFFMVCVIVSAFRYLSEELLHTWKNAKRSAREFMWDMEWKLKHH